MGLAQSDGFLGGWRHTPPPPLNRGCSPWRPAVVTGRTWVPPSTRSTLFFLECGSSRWAARNDGLWKTTACGDDAPTRINRPRSWTRPPPLDLPRLLLHCSCHTFPPWTPATDAHHRSFTSRASPHSRGWRHLELRPCPSDAFVKRSCFTNVALHVPPSANLTPGPYTYRSHYPTPFPSPVWCSLHNQAADELRPRPKNRDHGTELGQA